MIFIPREEEKQESNLLVLIPAEDKIRMMPLSRVAMRPTPLYMWVLEKRKKH